MFLTYSTDSGNVYGARGGELDGLGSVYGGLKVVKLCS